MIFIVLIIVTNEINDYLILFRITKKLSIKVTFKNIKKIKISFNI